MQEETSQNTVIFPLASLGAPFLIITHTHTHLTTPPLRFSILTFLSISNFPQHGTSFQQVPTLTFHTRVDGPWEVLLGGSSVIFFPNVPGLGQAEECPRVLISHWDGASVVMTTLPLCPMRHPFLHMPWVPSAPDLQWCLGPSCQER